MSALGVTVIDGCLETISIKTWKILAFQSKWQEDSLSQGIKCSYPHGNT
jgi:hypothetical protein